MKPRTPRTTLFAVDAGDTGALPVLFIHGFPFSHEMWLGQMEMVSRSYRAIAYDVRGHGKSPVDTGQYMIEGHVEDLVILLDELSVQRCVVVGLSMGGYIALRAMEKYPERFMAAALCHTRSDADTNEGKLKRYQGVTAVRRDGSSAFAETFVNLLFTPESLRTCPSEVKAIRATIASTPPLSIAGTLIALAARTDTTASLARITVPTLIMTGEFDALTPPAASQAMHVRISGSEIAIIPGAAHMSNLENPEFFNEQLLQFLKRVSQIDQKRV
ncbi:MAG: alpha/beta hydrolase [Ignavibacteria bacterium]|nr:alpha/beta hydrolase [Ignavibacteria bacterium]